MALPKMSTEKQRRAIGLARTAARRAAIDLARDSGAQIIHHPAFPGAHTTIPDVEPLAGMRAAREIELAARHGTRNYIHDVREAGHSWHQIGTALQLVPGGDAEQVGDTIAEAAFSYAAGNPDTEMARCYGRSIPWTCRSCEAVISDHGLCNGPAEDEHGHTGLDAGRSRPPWTPPARPPSPTPIHPHNQAEGRELT